MPSIRTANNRRRRRQRPRSIDYTGFFVALARFDRALDECARSDPWARSLRRLTESDVLPRTRLGLISPGLQILRNPLPIAAGPY